jgi:hypothetical protein
MLSVCFAAFTRRDEWRQGIASVGQVGLGLIVSADMLFGKLHISLFPFSTIHQYDYPTESHLFIFFS